MKRIFVVLIFIGLTSLQAVANGTGTAQSDIEKLMDKIKLECKGGLKKFGESEVFGEFQMSKSFHEFTMLTEANIDYTLNDFLEIAPDRESQIIFMQAFLQYSPRDFLKALSAMVKLRAENKIEDDIFKILISPAKASKNEYFFSLNYKDPRVRKILHAIAHLYKDDPDYRNFNNPKDWEKAHLRDYILINQRLNRKTMYLPFLNLIDRKSFIREKRIVQPKDELARTVEQKTLSENERKVICKTKKFLKEFNLEKMRWRNKYMGTRDFNPEKLKSYVKLRDYSMNHWRLILDNLRDIAGRNFGDHSDRSTLLRAMQLLRQDDAKEFVNKILKMYRVKKITRSEFMVIFPIFFKKSRLCNKRYPYIDPKSHWGVKYLNKVRSILRTQDDFYLESLIFSVLIPSEENKK